MQAPASRLTSRPYTARSAANKQENDQVCDRASESTDTHPVSRSESGIAQKKKTNPSSVATRRSSLRPRIARTRAGRCASPHFTVYCPLTVTVRVRPVAPRR